MDGYAVVSEAGASVYSASSTAREEYPLMEITYLGAISIAQRLVSPLNELVKIPSGSLGVGMYQRDLSDKALDQRLSDVVSICVNEVGVDVNSSSIHLLQRVSGINHSQAQSIIDFRKTSGEIRSRKDLLKVKGIGPAAFKNASGFLRIKDGSNPLENTCTHPDVSLNESYCRCCNHFCRMCV
jgi:protein Tex